MNNNNNNNNNILNFSITIAIIYYILCVSKINWQFLFFIFCYEFIKQKKKRKIRKNRNPFTILYKKKTHTFFFLNSKNKIKEYKTKNLNYFITHKLDVFEVEILKNRISSVFYFPSGFLLFISNSNVKKRPINAFDIKIFDFLFDCFT